MDDKPVRKVRPEWADVMRETVLVDLTIGRWRGQVKTDWSQLGLPAEAFQRAFTPGARRLLPLRIAKELEQIEQLCRATLERYALRTLFGFLMSKERYFEWRDLLTKTPLAEVRRRLYGSDVPEYAPRDIWNTTSAYDRWMELGEEIARNRDVIVAEVAVMYEAALEDVWRRQNDIVPRNRDLDSSEQAALRLWIDDKKEQIVSSIPTSDYIRQSFVLDWQLAEVETPPEVIKEAKLEELERRERELQQAIREAKSESERLEYERERARVELDRAIAEEIARQRDDAGRRFNQAIDEIIGQLQGAIYEMVLDQLEYLNANGSLHPRNVGRISKMVDLVRNRLIGLTDDESLRKACDELEKLVESGATRESAAPQVAMTLRKIALDMKTDLIEAGVPSRSGRALGIPDEPVQIMQIIQRAARLLPDTDAVTPATEPEPVALERTSRQLAI